MIPSPNTLLWKFTDAIVPLVWKSKQAKRIYDAAVTAEKSGVWTDHAVGGSVRCVSNRSNIPRLTEPQFGTDCTDELIALSMQQHIEAVRRHADRMESALRVYGPHAFRKRVAQMPAPIHPFEAEAAILAILNGGYDEIIVHGVRFVRDDSGAFVPANTNTQD